MLPGQPVDRRGAEVQLTAGELEGLVQPVGRRCAMWFFYTCW